MNPWTCVKFRHITRRWQDELFLFLLTGWPNEVETSDGICPTSWLWFFDNDWCQRSVRIWDMENIVPPQGRCMTQGGIQGPKDMRYFKVCVFFFFRTFTKAKATGGEKLGPIFLTRLVGRLFWTSRDRGSELASKGEEQTPKNLSVTDQRLRWPRDTAGGQVWTVESGWWQLNHFVWMFAPPGRGRWTHFWRFAYFSDGLVKSTTQLGMLSFQGSLHFRWRCWRLYGAKAKYWVVQVAFDPYLPWKKSFLLVMVVYGDNGDTWFTIQISSHPVFLFGAWIFSEPAQAGFPRSLYLSLCVCWLIKDPMVDRKWKERLWLHLLDWYQLCDWSTVEEKWDPSQFCVANFLFFGNQKQ